MCVMQWHVREAGYGGGGEDGMSSCGFVSVSDFMCEWTLSM